MQGIQDPSSQTFSQLLGQPQVKYIVPNFQRDYSWSEDQWSDLWQDIKSIWDKKDDAHYMGYLVLQPKQSSIEIIDGQQRIATITILLIVIIRRLKDLIDKGEDVNLNTLRVNELSSSFIGITKLDSGLLENKLTLNKNNNDFFKTYIIDSTQPIPKKLVVSTKLLIGCLDWFYTIMPTSLTGIELVEISTIITTKLFFSTLRVEGDVNAFKVFETLNARGVELSSIDLLKNYLFQIADQEGSQSDLKEMEDYWSGMVTELGQKNVVDYVRAYWNGRTELTRKNELFRSIRSKITNKKEAFDFIKELYVCPKDTILSLTLHLRHGMANRKYLTHYLT